MLQPLFSISSVSQNIWKPLGLKSILSPHCSFNHFDPYAPTNHYGLIKIGGELHTDWILEAYSKGIFPWYDEPPIKWYSPPYRLILRPDDFKISRSFSKFLHSHHYQVQFDTAFKQVIHACASSPRKYFGETTGSTWINSEIIRTYENLHRLGIAHSVEVWKEEKLVGGLYGLSLGKLFFGESMFFIESDCSKLALYTLCQFLKEREFLAIDCQVYSEHLESLGGVSILKNKFLKLLLLSHREASLIGKWNGKIGINKIKEN